jgi:Putative MetA-pathway of phenol degradation
MTDGSITFNATLSAHPQPPSIRLARVIIGPLLLISLTALGVGCQSLPMNDQPDRAPETTPATEAPSGPEDGDSDSDPRRGPSSGPDGDDASNTTRAGTRGFLGFPPLRELLDDDDDDDDDPPRPKKRTEADIRSPGPDTANFPNSPYTLPQGRAYIEASPVFLSGPSHGTPSTYNAEFLLRYGLTDRVELRLFSNGPTFERGPFAANGMAPLAWDIKTNLWKQNLEYHIPAVGLEVFLLTPSGSKGINQGTQPSITLLFAHTLPFGIELEWNVGLVGDPSPNNNFSAIEPAAAWAFEREVFEDFFVFFQGYFNGPTLPRFGDGVELGFGARWTLTKRFCLFGSYNGGVSREAPTTIFQFGGAMAF